MTLPHMLIHGKQVASFADYWGRKKCCLLYCVVYSVGCLTKNFSYWPGLLFGRFCGGVATSILFAVFEAWAVAEATAPLVSVDTISPPASCDSLRRCPHTRACVHTLTQPAVMHETMVLCR